MDPASPSQLSLSAVHALVEYEWPGNVRQLRHVLERAWILAEGSVVSRAIIDATLGEDVWSRGTDTPRSDFERRR
jgi:DNA-binding NtrC family response regulator